MKKFISAISAAALALTGIAAAVPSSQAAEDKIDKIVLLGDSITSGYGLKKSEYNYGQIIADYIGADAKNYAVPGAESGDLYNRLGEEAVAADIKDADLVVISIGANDMMHFAAERLLAVGKSADCLKDEYANEPIPDNPTLGQVKDMLDKNKLKKFASSTTNKITISSELSKLSNDLGMTSDSSSASRYKRVIETQVIPNITSSISKIKELNPDAEIMLETVYNPLNFEPTFFASNYDGTYQTLLGNLVVKFDSVLGSFSKQLNTCAEENGATVVDVMTAFDSAEGNVKYTWYFEKMQDEKIDIHPNQAGNVAIAAEILNKLSEEGKITLHDDDGLLNKAYNNITNKESYPAAAYATLSKVLGDPSKVSPPVTEPEPATKPEPATEPATKPEPATEPATKPEPATEPATKPEPATEPATKPEPATEPATKPEPATEPATKPEPATEPATEPEYVLGDFNSDKMVDANDASAILEAYALLSTTGNELTEVQQLAGDVNKDTFLDSNDASIILSFYAANATGYKKSLSDFIAGK